MILNINPPSSNFNSSDPFGFAAIRSHSPPCKPSSMTIQSVLNSAALDLGQKALSAVSATLGIVPSETLTPLLDAASEIAAGNYVVAFQGLADEALGSIGLDTSVIDDLVSEGFSDVSDVLDSVSAADPYGELADIAVTALVEAFGGSPNTAITAGEIAEGIVDIIVICIDLF